MDGFEFLAFVSHRYDKHVVPNERVTDFRTFVSGVKAKDLRGGLPLRQCQNEVAAILKGKVLVGHALHNDLKVPGFGNSSTLQQCRGYVYHPW